MAGVVGGDLVGQGGHGAVYRAEQPALGRTVAVKLVTTAGADARVLQRFQRECTAIGSLSGHPNIVAVYAAGATDSGVPYLVMQLLRRGSLADWLAARGAMDWPEVAPIGVKLAGALATAHAAGVLHRDIKPANVLLSDYGEPMLADFGVARVAGATETTSGGPPLTLAHASPEAVSGLPATERADVWSLASTLHELLSGEPPFLRPTDENLIPLLARLASEPPPDLRPLGVPDPLCRALEAGLAKDPEERAASARDLGELLRAAEVAMGLPPTVMPIAGFPDPAPTFAYRPPRQSPHAPPLGGPEPVPTPVPTRPPVAEPGPGAATPPPGWEPGPATSTPPPWWEPRPGATTPPPPGGEPSRGTSTPAPTADAVPGASTPPAGTTPEVPTGTFTFLFSDMEGSTKLLEALGDRYGEVLDTYRRVTAEAVVAHSGRVLDVQGDNVLAVFGRASHALAAAAAAQRGLAAAAWPSSPVKVRMAVHAGEAVARPEGFVGVALNRGARLAEAGHGGQVLVSELTRQLTERLDEGVLLVPLGIHQLRDWPAPEPIHQLVWEGRITTFPPLRGVLSTGASPRLIELDADRTHILAEGRNVIGRDAACHVVIEDRDKLVSRRHCLVQVTAGAVEVEDLASRNGTYVNGVRIDRPTTLLPGARLRIGHATFVLDGGEGKAAGRRRRRQRGVG